MSANLSDELESSPSLGALIRSRRLALEMSVNDLARSIGVSKVTVWKWESGRTRPRVDRLEQLSVVLDVPFDFFWLAGGLDEASFSVFGPQSRIAYRPGEIGARIRQVRIARGQTVERLADALKVTQSILYSIEKGKTRPSVALILQFCEHFQIRIGAFFNETDSRSAAAHRFVQKYDRVLEKDDWATLDTLARALCDTRKAGVASTDRG